MLEPNVVFLIQKTDYLRLLIDLINYKNLC
ncbi:MAG: hypothetical protein JWQ54_1577 [Mucilaginibacter sp.]|nr:hypothetical protein [Mucilaginibacter sp.]